MADAVGMNANVAAMMLMMARVVLFMLFPWAFSPNARAMRPLSLIS